MVSIIPVCVWREKIVVALWHTPLACFTFRKTQEQLQEAIHIPTQVGVDMQIYKHNVSILGKLYRITPAGV